MSNASDVPNLRDLAVGDTVFVSGYRPLRGSPNWEATVSHVTLTYFQVGMNGRYNFDRQTGVDMSHGSKSVPMYRARTAEMVAYDEAGFVASDELNSFGVTVRADLPLRQLQAILAVLKEA
jgi:hypothetical protein